MLNRNFNLKGSFKSLSITSIFVICALFLFNQHASATFESNINPNPTYPGYETSPSVVNDTNNQHSATSQEVVKLQNTKQKLSQQSQQLKAPTQRIYAAARPNEIITNYNPNADYSNANAAINTKRSKTPLNKKMNPRHRVQHVAKKGVTAKAKQFAMQKKSRHVAKTERIEPPVHPEVIRNYSAPVEQHYTRKVRHKVKKPETFFKPLTGLTMYHNDIQYSSPAWYRYGHPDQNIHQSLHNVMHMTTRSNPTVLQTESEQYAAREGIMSAKAAYFPRIDLTIGMGKERTDSVTTGFTTLSLTRKERQVTASQLLWDGWGTINQIRSSKYQYQATVFQTAEQKELTALRVTEVYLDMLRFSQLTALSVHNVVTHQETLRKVRLRFKGGAGHKADTDLAEGRLAQAISTKLASDGLLRDGRAAYISVTGINPTGLQMPRLPRVPNSLKVAIKKAYYNSPAIKVAKKNIAVACANLRVAKSTFWPTFTLEGAISRNRNLDGLRGPNNEELGMVMMRYNLFNGGADVAAVRQAVFNYESTLHALKEVKRTVKENVTTAWNNLEIARLRVVQLNERVINTKEVLVAYQKQFELGQRSLLNLVDTERELFNAKSDLINSQFLVSTSTYRLLASMGTLVRTVN